MENNTKKPLRVCIIGSAHPLRGGGMTTFNHRLAKAFMDEGHDTTIYSFSLQYPNFLFPGTSQFTDESAPEHLRIITRINSINPLNWWNVGNAIAKEKFDIVVIRYWLPFMGPCLGTIARRIKKNKYSKIICIADNIIPHEKRKFDTQFTNYFIPPIDKFVVMSEQVQQDCKTLGIKKTVQLVAHPLYDNFGEAISKADALKKLNISSNKSLLLAFGFIRHYKGLDILLEALAMLKTKRQDFQLIVAGEFYEDAKPYLEIIDKHSLHNEVILKTNFIPDEEVRNYLCATDFVVQPYRSATQSGVSPLAYYYDKPMLVTNVGGLPQLVPHKEAGIVAEPNAEAIAAGLDMLLSLNRQELVDNMQKIKQKLSWQTLIQYIID
jgi:glycosyltransferase involved in cell wall biosynthesis